MTLTGLQKEKGTQAGEESKIQHTRKLSSRIGKLAGRAGDHLCAGSDLRGYRGFDFLYCCFHLVHIQQEKWALRQCAINLDEIENRPLLRPGAWA